MAAPTIMTGENSGSTALFNMQAKLAEQAQTIGTYHAYARMPPVDDDYDINLDENIKYKHGTTVRGIITDDPTKYLGLNATNYHPYYDVNKSSVDIKKAYLLASNKDIPYGDRNGVPADQPTKEQQMDIDILRRVVKQAPMLIAKAQFVQSIIGLVIVTIIFIVCYIIYDFSAWYYTPIAILWLLSFGSSFYRIYYSSKQQGLQDWSELILTIENITKIKPNLVDINKDLFGPNGQPAPAPNGQMYNGQMYNGQMYNGQPVYNQPPPAQPSVWSEVLGTAVKGVVEFFVDKFKSKDKK